MTLRGIDVSSWQGYPFEESVQRAYNESDFVMVKATEGTSYTNELCDAVVQDCIADGKLWGFYHYAKGFEPEKEAAYFVSECSGYFGHGIPALDFESYTNTQWGNRTWCRRFVDKVHALTGVWCVIYIQGSALEYAENCKDDCGLWVAAWTESQYWIDREPNYVSPWNTWTLWQFTSQLYDSVDANLANLDREGWLRIAQGDNGNPQKEESWVTQAAREVIAGKFGNGEERKNALYNYIQSEVNRLMRT